MPVNTAKRREHIIDLLCEHGSVRVEQLSKQFAVSTVTIRNDLRFLERKGCALRAYGGAMLNQQFAFDRPLRDKGRLNRDVKTLIANAAAGYVRDGDALILDSGSTTAQIVPFLKGRRDLVVMTNALNIAYELSGNDGVEVMVLGQRAPQLLLALRSGCRAAIASVPLRQAVLGVDGFDLSAGITTPHPVRRTSIA